MHTEDICSQCNLGFKESSIAFCKRLRLNTKKICRDCNRINFAEKRADKRNREKMKENKISILRMMRTKKITYEEALRIHEKHI